MLHNTSSDPVLIKKISLKIWSLRDEIELRLQQKVDAGEILSENLDEKIAEIRKEYTKKDQNLTTLASPSTDAVVDEGELAMARAIEAENNPTETPSEEIGGENDNVIALPKSANQDEKFITIGVEFPGLADDKVSKGKTILSEITMDKMFFFCNKAFTEGQSIVIQFCIPKTFILNADVLYCRQFNIKSRIISDNNYTHRMLIKFNFLREGERALLREFIKSIEPDLTAVAVKNVDNDKSDFDDLDL